jgi:hypothetical protein
VWGQAGQGADVWCLIAQGQVGRVQAATSFAARCAPIGLLHERGERQVS